jgi:hypothetical protein
LGGASVETIPSIGIMEIKIYDVRIVINYVYIQDASFRTYVEHYLRRSGHILEGAAANALTVDGCLVFILMGANWTALNAC